MKTGTARGYTPVLVQRPTSTVTQQSRPPNTNLNNFTTARRYVSPTLEEITVITLRTDNKSPSGNQWLLSSSPKKWTWRGELELSLRSRFLSRCRCRCASRLYSTYIIYTHIYIRVMYRLSWTQVREGKGRRTRPLATKSDWQLRAPRETLTATAVPPSRPQCRLVTRCREDCDWSGLSLSLPRARLYLCRLRHDSGLVHADAYRLKRGKGEGGEGRKRGQFTPGLYSQFMRQPPSYPLPTLTTTTTTNIHHDSASDRLSLSPHQIRHAAPTVRSTSPSTPVAAAGLYLSFWTGAIRLRRARGCDTQLSYVSDTWQS